MEIGSFIGLDLEGTGEYYNNQLGMARLNSARAGIYHACRLYNCTTVHLPYYLCPSVDQYLTEKGIITKKYHINEQFEPVGVQQKKEEAILIVNYFGIIANKNMQRIAERYRNVIVDNSAAFYASPLDDCYNIYSPRKFFGVPDGCYVIGDCASKGTDEYEEDISSSTASFLFKSIEFGTNATYQERMKNESRIDHSKPLRMSKLSMALLKNINYSRIAKKRVENFMYANLMFSKLNRIDPLVFFDKSCVPMVYPLVIESTDLDAQLRENKIYVGRLWNSVLKEVTADSFEAHLSKFMLPLPIDQRYGRKEMNYIYNVITEILDTTK